MADLVPSLIRTYVPILVGQVAAWLALKGVQLDEQTVLAAATALGGIISALYYLAVRLLEQKFPQLGILLGSTKKPEYTEPK